MTEQEDSIYYLTASGTDLAGNEVNNTLNDKDAEIYLINELGEKVQTWDYLALAGEEGKEITIEIPSSDMRQSLLFYAVDEAGNEVQSLKDNEQTPKSFLITTNPWLRYKNSAVAKGITVAVVGVVALVGAGFYYRRRKKDLGSK